MLYVQDAFNIIFLSIVRNVHTHLHAHVEAMSCCKGADPAHEHSYPVLFKTTEF